MSKISFSPTQELAINAKGENYLISAGAGSGKTAVLTERIYRIVKKSKTLDNFLVLTFTRFAAQEMKDRIRKALLNDPETMSVATEVDNAHVETIDSFSLYLVKKYFYKLGISKDINVVDQAVLDIKRKELIDNLFEELYQKEDPAFLSLVDAYVLKDENRIKDFIVRVLAKADGKVDDEKFFTNLESRFTDGTFINQLIDLLYEEIHLNLNIIKDKAIELQDVREVDNICNFIDNILSIKTYDELIAFLSNDDLSSFPTKVGELDEADRALRSAMVNFYGAKIKINSKNIGFGTSAEIKEQYFGIKDYVKEIVYLCRNISSKLKDFKKENNAYSFGDITRYVFVLLKDEEIRKEISLSFDYIMLDEYQDTSEIQESIINAISRNNVYMVGDVKQSIYLFRGADCSLFQKKFNAYKKEIGGKEIELNTSFRSRREVIDFVNDIFSQLMTLDKGEIDYPNGHIFEFGLKKYDEEKTEFNYKPEVYNFPIDGNASKVVDDEIDIIIKDIFTKIKMGYKVLDKDNGFRKCKYSDFSIIMDRRGEFSKYRRKFAEHNIPLKVIDKEDFFTSDVIYVVKNLIKMLYYSQKGEYENEYHHAFFSVARSFLYQYSDGKLFKIAKERTYLNEPFAQKIELLKEKLRFKSLKQILTTLYEEFDIYQKISRITNYYANVHKLERLISIADSFDSLRYSRDDFVKFFDDLANINLDIEYKENSSSIDAVTLINIHQSKGLEYPIIYFP